MNPPVPPLGDGTRLLRVFVPEPRARIHAVLAVAVAVGVHGALALAVPCHAIEPPQADPPPTQMIEMLLPPPPPPEVSPPAPPPSPAPPPPTAPTRAVQPRSAPPPAHAAAVITQKADPAAPADFTNSIVVGTGETYAGGATSATGTTQRTVEVASKTPGGTGVAAAPAATGAARLDRSRRAHLAGGAAWNCGFPHEADEAQIDHAVVALRISVDQLGAAEAVAVVSDPGNGFGREARACAMVKRYEPALNQDGQPVRGTALINVRFDR